MKRIICMLLLLLFIPVTACVAATEATEETGGNLVRDGAFDLITNDFSSMWHRSGADYIQLDSESKNSGKYAARISINDSSWQYISQGVANLIPCAEYTLSACVKTNLEYNSLIGFTLKCQTPEGEMEQFKPMTDTKGVFEKQSFSFTLPEDCTSILVMFRQFGSGTSWLDDITLTYKNAPLLFAEDAFEIGDVFHYPHEKTGYAWLRLAKFYAERPEGAETTVDFELLDGDMVLASKKNVHFENGTTEFTYDIGLLKTKKKAYEVRATARYQDQMRVYTQNVYVYDRPSTIEDNGVIRIDGKLFNPVMAYHVSEDSYETLAGAGINVVQFGLGGGENYTEAYLDNCDKALAKMDRFGMKALFVLYDGAPAASERNYAYTRAFVERFKDDSRIFAWAIYDEPFAGVYNPEMREMMEKSYKLVRDIDDMHPVHLTNVHTETPKFCDIFTIDAYTYIDDTQGVTFWCEKIRNAHKGEVLMQYLGSSFANEADADSLPSVKRIRSYMYRAFEAGMKGVGYYSINDAVPGAGGNPPTPFYETDRWPGVCAFGKNELPVLFDIYVNNKYTCLNEKLEGNTETGTYWGIWQDNDMFYLLVHNKSNRTATIAPTFASADGKTIITPTDIRKIGGIASVPPIDSLTFDLEAQDVALYQILLNGKFKEPSPVNLLKNGDFDVASTSQDTWTTIRYYDESWHNFVWSTQGENFRKQDSESGNGYLLLNPTYSIEGCPVVKPNTSYTLSVQYKSEGDVDFTIEAESYLKNDQLVGDSYPLLCANGEQTNGTWKTATMDFTTPNCSDVKYIKIFAKNYASSNLYLDNLSLVENGNPVNYLQNGNFEQMQTNGEPASWTKENDNTQNQLSVVLDGDNNHCMKVIAKDTNSYCNYYQTVHLPAGRYKLSFRYKTETAGLYPRAIYITGITTLLGEAAIAPSETNVWNQYETYFSILDDTATKAGTVLKMGFQSNEGTYYYDDFCLTQDNDNALTYAEGITTKQYFNDKDLDNITLTGYNPVTTIEKLPANTDGSRTVTAHGHFVSDGTTPQNVSLLTCVYETANGVTKLSDFAISNGDQVAVGKIWDGFNKVTIPKKEDGVTYSVRTFLWDSVSGLKPIEVPLVLN